MGLRTDVGITHQVRGLSYLVRVTVSHSLIYTHTHTPSHSSGTGSYR